MQRNKELIRTLLLAIEKDPKFDGTSIIQVDEPSEFGLEHHSYAELAYHLNLLIEAGYVLGETTMQMQMPTISKLTWQGHEFLEDIRDPEIWRTTKDRAKKLAGLGLGLMWEIAKAEIKAKVGLP